MNLDDIDLFRSLPTLETNRLILRRMKVSDAQDMYEYSCLKDVTEYLLWSPHSSVKYTRNYLRSVQISYRRGDFYDWGIEYKADGKFIGTVGFTSFDIDNNCGEIGYVLNPDYWKMGIATEAVKRIIAFGRDELELHRIEARYMEGNDASRHVMEKCGMTFEGMQKDKLFVKGLYRNIGTCAIVFSFNA